MRLIGPIVWYRSLNYMWARIGPCAISIRRWRFDRDSPWLWKVYEVFGSLVPNPVFEALEKAQERAGQIAGERFAQLATYFSRRRARRSS